jgi:hypothetical protein
MKPTFLPVEPPVKWRLGMMILIYSKRIAIRPDDSPKTEREIIAARIASYHKWNRRRRILRLRATLFSRRKARRRAEEKGFREGCTACAAPEIT